MLRLILRPSAYRLHSIVTLPLHLPNLAAVDTLRIAAFRHLWGSHGLANLANQMRFLVIAWLVLDMTDSQLWVGLANGLPAIAVAAFSLGGGVLVDRISPKAVLFRVRLTMAIASLLTAFLVSAGMIQLWHILLLTLLMGGVNAIEIVAARVCLSAVVSKEQLLNALSLTTMVRNLAVILGPSLAGILLARGGPASALWLLTAVFVLTVFALWKLKKCPAIARNPQAETYWTDSCIPGELLTCAGS